MGTLRIVVGLGNPGRRYERTRHNAGCWICRILAEGWGLKLSRRRFEGQFDTGRFEGAKVAILLPLTYMNQAGRSVAAATEYYGLRVEDLLVVHDDVDLEPGRVKVKRGGGSGGHKGVGSIESCLGDGEFYRLRFGVGRPEDPRWDMADYVLSKVPEGLLPFFEEKSKRAAEAVEYFLREGLEATQNRYHYPGGD